METLPQLDQIDRKILDYLQGQAKLTNVQVAQNINLSPASTLERVKKLERQGIIKSYHAQIDPKKLALETYVMMQITLHRLTTKSVTDFIESMGRIPEVVTCHQVVGDADFFVKVVTTDMAAYQQLVMDQFGKLQDIQCIKAFIITATVKETGVPVKEPLLRSQS